MPVTYSLFMLVRATPAWLALPPPERSGWFDRIVRPLLARRPAVRLRYFDAEFFHARISDVMLWQTGDLDAWRALVEDLRETPFWGHYFEVLEIVPTVEDAWSTHYGAAPAGG
ncbi:MAG: darcynin family protein [Pseudomonadota bacterium]|nr:darcynin family protein [Pseudomonadota bacterium]